MISVIVLDAIDDSALELVDKLVLLILQNMLERLLNHLTISSPPSQIRDTEEEGPTLHPYISRESLTTFPSILLANLAFWL
jgi:hypothetical protein